MVYMLACEWMYVSITLVKHYFLFMKSDYNPPPPHVRK